MDNHTTEQKHRCHFTKDRDNRNTSRLDGSSVTISKHSKEYVDRIVFQEEVTDCDDCRNLEEVADQRNQSSVRAFTFGYTLFIVNVEYTHFTAAEAANQMNAKTERKHNVCIGGKVYYSTAECVNNQMHNYNACKTNREHTSNRVHSVDVCIQAVNAANLFLEKVFQVRQCVQKANARRKHRQQIERCRDEFHR